MRVGTAVTGPDGGIGIVTEPIRKSGPNRGRVAVQWVRMNYDVSEWPETLTPVTLTATPIETETR